MPRRERCVLAGVPCHVTQRGVDRRETFTTDSDRETYLALLRRNRDDAGVRVLGWCLMTNHIHLIALPEAQGSLAVLLRRVHGRYAQYYNTRHGRSGHLWQNRYFACLLGPGHLQAALEYVDRNPERAGLVSWPGDYRWSSAAAHLTASDRTGLLDLEWWRKQYDGFDWAQVLGGPDGGEAAQLRRCTYAGQPFGDGPFVQAISEEFGRHWTRGRPRSKQVQPEIAMAVNQLPLFEESKPRRG